MSNAGESMWLRRIKAKKDQREMEPVEAKNIFSPDPAPFSAPFGGAGIPGQ
jgi:hypothetical protein